MFPSLVPSMMPTVRAVMYNTIMVDLTKHWYKAVLDRLPHGAHLIDVGTGPGRSLASNAETLRKKNISTVCIEFDKDYAKACTAELARENLLDRCKVVHTSVYDYVSPVPPDAAYFSCSLMVMPDPVRALTHVSSLLKPGCKIYCTQTFEHHQSEWIHVVKKALTKVTTVDFGSVTYEDEFHKTVQAANLTVEEDVFLMGTKKSDARSYRLVVLKK